MTRFQELGFEIWETLAHLLPGREHERQELALAVARNVLERPSFFDREQYQANDEDEPELLAKAEMALVVLMVLETIQNHG